MHPRKKRSVEEQLRRELSTIILCELRDPRRGFVTITGVELARDQRSAEVRLTVRGSEEDTRNSLSALRHARGYIQHLIGTRLSLRYTPVLTFVEDKQARRAAELEALIDEARRDDRRATD
jgi:ribosome-binding factor A